MADWLGRPKDDLIGIQFHEILGFGGRIAFETHLAPLLRMQGFVYEIAVDLIDKDQRRIPTIVNAAEKRGPDGRHLFTRVTLFKAVDRRTYERSLLEARLKAEAESTAEKEASLLREQFIAVLGHDLRNPIAAIGAGAHLLEQREDLSSRGRRIVTEMHGSIGRAERLIADLLDFARGRLGGGISLDRNYQLLGSTFEQVVGEIRAVAPDHLVEADIRADAPVYCDRGRLAQLASNLLANAVTHGAAGKPVHFSVRTCDGQLILTVDNEGDPIPQERLDRLFQPFFRSQERSSANGLGLGLFIASEIAKAHGGTIDVNCSKRRIAFSFTMPLTAPAA